MKTKRILLLALIALMSWGITGCAEDEAISIVNVMGMQVKYEPQSPEKMPKWLLTSAMRHPVRACAC